MIYYTADLHFGHKNIISGCNRPFDDVEEMNETLIRNWNARVDDADTVFVLGDLFFAHPQPEAVLGRLSGRKILIIGNHDDAWLDHGDVSRHFSSIAHYLEIEDDGRRATLCHYPMMAWKDAKSAWMIHGHIHNNPHSDYWPLIRASNHMLNAGIDVNGFRPVTFDELIANNVRFKAEN